MKLLIFADSHAHPFTQFSVGEGKSNSRLLKTLEVIDEIREFAKAQGIQNVIHLGDLMHSATSFKYEHFNAVYGCIRKFTEDGIHLKIILGNHDLIGRSVDYGSKIDTLGDICDLIHTPTLLFGPASEDRVYAVPYEKDFSRAVSELDKAPDGSIVLHHLDIVGADTGHGWVSEIGIGRDNFERFKLSLGGHYHKRQAVLDNCYYIGCCCPQSFVEKDQHGQFVVLDTETLCLTWYNTSAPVFKEWNPEVTPVADFDNCYVRVKAEPTPELESKLKQSGALKWIFVPEKRKQITMQRQSGIDVDADLFSVTKTYAEVHGNRLNVKELVRVGQELIKESL